MWVNFYGYVFIFSNKSGNIYVIVKKSDKKKNHNLLD